MARALGIATVLFAIAPLFVLSAYAHPSTDDFCYANATRDMGFWQAQKSWYANWSGRIVGSAAMSLAPLSAVEMTGYKVFAVVTLIVSYVGLFWLIYEALWDRVATSTILSAALVVFALFVSVMPSPAEAIYWYTGAVVYTCGAAAALFSVSAAARGQRAGSRSGARLWTVVSALFAFLAAGSNEAVLILLGLGISVIGLLAYRRKAPRWGLWLVPVVVIALTAAVGLFAPGNAKRAEVTDGFGGALTPIFGSAALSVAYMIEWLSSGPLLFGLAAIVLFGISMAEQIEPNSAWRRTPWLLPFVVAGIGVWMTFFLTAWASGFSFRPGPPLRVANVVWLFFLLAAACTGFMIGLQRLSTYATQAAVTAAHSWLVLAMAVAMLGQGNLRGAYEDLVTGRAAGYDARLDERYAVVAIAQQRQEDATVQALDRVPTTIHFRDITTDSSDWRNRCFAQFWGVPNVRVSP